MVLYANAKGAARPGKAKWVMHQYHIGPEEDELEGQLVVSKIFYQQHSAATHSEIECGEESEMLGVKVDPRTPNTSTPLPPRLTEDSPKEDNGNSLQFLLNQCHEYSFPIDSRNNNDISTAAEAISTPQEFSDLDYILIDTPPDFQLAVRFLINCLVFELFEVGLCLWLAHDAGLAIWFPRKHDELAGQITRLINEDGASDNEVRILFCVSHSS